MKKVVFLLLTVVTILITSCKNSGKTILPVIKGNSFDLIVVMPNRYWESESGELVKEKFGQNVTGILQPEPIFDVSFINQQSLNSLFQRRRNICIIKIGVDLKQKVIVQRDEWASPQLIVTITAPNEDAFIEFYKKRADEIIEIFKKAEKERLTNTFKKKYNKKIYNYLLKNHDIMINVPAGYEVDLDTNNFIWLGYDYKDIIEGILIYYYPYVDTNSFELGNLVNKRNELTKKFVPGELEGSYMTIEGRVPIEKTIKNINGKYTVELRGLWRVDSGLAMGGSFVSITQYDLERQRIVTAEGFVFAPAHDKRDIIHRVESIIGTIEYKKQKPEKSVEKK